MQIVKERQQFQRVEVSRDEAMSMFQENPFKIEILSGLPQEATITLYRCSGAPALGRLQPEPCPVLLTPC